MPFSSIRKTTALACVAILIAFITRVDAQTSSGSAKRYGPGVTDGEIKIGNITTYSGPASAYGAIAKTESAYFAMINEAGGVNGRKINFISYDDGFSPPKTVEHARRLVEGDEVLLIFSALGTPTNLAIRRYMNEKQVPQLFIASGSSSWNDPEHFPWSIGWQPNYRSEGRIYGKFILKERPNGKIGILFENDDYGRDLVTGIKEGLGDRANSMIVDEEAYAVSEPTVDSHIVSLKSAGPDVFISVTAPKFAAQSIRKAAELDWKPLFILNNTASSVAAVLKPAGFENAQGIVSAAYMKDPTDPQWKNDSGIDHFDSFLRQHFPEGNRSDGYVLYGYNAAQTLIHVLTACGDDLTRENVMKQAANIDGLQLEAVAPGVTLNTSATDFAPIKQMQLMKFAGTRFERFVEVISSETGK